MGIFKIESGLIFDDRFDYLDSRWQISPSGYVSVQNNQLVLQHSDSYDGTKVLFDLPQNEEKLLLQVEADYTPSEIGDEGGILIWNNALNKLEFLESVEVNRSDEYSIWQARKRGQLWSFYAQRSGSWELFDSAALINPPMAGVVLKGYPNNNFKPLIISRAILCKGSSITVGNVNSGYRVELLDENDVVVSSQIIPEYFAGTEIELPSIPFTGRLRIYDKPTPSYPTGRLLSEQLNPVVFYGGDVYLHGTDLQIIWNGQELNTDGVTHLGTMQNNIILTKMTVRNVTTGNIAENIEVAIRQYKDEFGWEWVDIANDENGSPGTWANVIQLGTLHPGEEIDFWVKVEKNYAHWSTKPTHFIFDVNHQ
jgi:hypothetical protein